MAETKCRLSLVETLMVNRQPLTSYIDRRMPGELRGSIDASDVIQDIVCIAIHEQDRFVAMDDGAGLRWLQTVARNRLMRILQERRGWGATPRVQDALDDLLCEAAVYDRTPSESAMSREGRKRVEEAISRLPPKSAAVIRHRYFDRMSFEQVAAVTNSNAHAVTALCHKARSMLREYLPPGLNYYV